jgi:ABC-type glycerol-3-phosphate transport system substrate-binding protein
MKRLFIALIVLAMAFTAMAAPQEITFLHSGVPQWMIDYGVGKLAKDFPGWKVTPLLIDLSNGSTMTMDALLAAGKSPNVLYDTLVRSSKYIVPAYALPLNGVVRDLNKYNDLAAYTRGGKVLALPAPGGAQGMCINLDIMDAIGYVVPDDWTIADFLEMAGKVKEKFGDKKWATGMFAANQSGDYLIQNWFPAFGVEFFKAGQYTISTVAKTGGAKVYEFFQTLAKEGYIPPNAATLNDDDYALQWFSSQLAATAFFPGWMDPYWKTGIEQKAIDKPFRVKYVPFPRGPGVKKSPTYSSNAAIVVRKTGAFADKVAARFAEYINDAWSQTEQTKGLVLPNRKDAKMLVDNESVAQVLDIVAKNGIYESGITTAKFPAIRTCQYPILQKVLTFKITPVEAAIAYEQAVNEASK